MKNEMEHWQLREEAASLRAEMDRTRSEIRQAQTELYQRHIENRKLPPMSQMTRLQKRYFLEPWMTVGAIASAFIALVGYVLACFLPWHWPLAMFGGLFTVVGAAFLIVKINFMEWNSKTETQISGGGPRQMDY